MAETDVWEGKEWKGTRGECGGGGSAIEEGDREIRGVPGERN